MPLAELAIAPCAQLVLLGTKTLHLLSPIGWVARKELAEFSRKQREKLGSCGAVQVNRTIQLH